MSDLKKDAACKGKTALFFPATGENSVQRERREAEAIGICHGCPVIYQCAVLARDQVYGVWAGVPRERTV